MHVESFVVCVVGKMAQDGVKVLWCHSHLVWLVFEASIPTCTCFHSENFLRLVSVAFLCCRLGMVRKRRKVGGEDTWSTFLFT